jgi:hypothetical protein
MKVKTCIIDTLPVTSSMRHRLYEAITKNTLHAFSIQFVSIPSINNILQASKLNDIRLLAMCDWSTGDAYSSWVSLKSDPNSARSRFLSACEEFMR